MDEKKLVQEVCRKGVIVPPLRYSEKEVQLAAGGWVRNSRRSGAGWACILRYANTPKWLTGRCESKSEIRMELMGIVAGLKQLKRPCLVAIATAASYLFESAGQLRRPRKCYGFVNDVRTGTAKNADLWKEFEQLCKTHAVHMCWVPARSRHIDSHAARHAARNASYCTN